MATNGSNGNRADGGAAEMRFAAAPERRLLRPQGSHRHIVFTIKVGDRREAPPARPALSLALVLDRSGSMSGGKLDTAKRAALAVLDQLSPADEVAVVVYDSVSDALQPRTPVTPAARAAVRAALTRVEPRDSTALHEGWLTGCHAIAADDAERAGPARCFLLTDGLANVGETDPERIATDAARIRQNAGISTSTFGIGADYDEGLLGPMAVAGGGQFHHLRHAHDIADTFVGELGGMLATAVTGVRIEVELAPDLTTDVVSAYWTGPDPTGGRLLIGVGDLMAGEERNVVVRFGFGAGRVGADRAVRARLVWHSGGAEHGSDWQEVGFTYASNQDCSRETRDAAVMHWVGLHHADRAQREASRLSRSGDQQGARRALRGVAHRLADYAFADPELQQALKDLTHLEEEIARAPLQPMAAKEVMFQAQRRSRGQRDFRKQE